MDLGSYQPLATCHPLSWFWLLTTHVGAARGQLQQKLATHSKANRPLFFTHPGDQVRVPFRTPLTHYTNDTMAPHSQTSLRMMTMTTTEAAEPHPHRR